MTAFTPLEATKRREATGIARAHAEAIAVRLSVILAAVITAAFAVLGFVLSN